MGITFQYRPLSHKPCQQYIFSSQTQSTGVPVSESKVYVGTGWISETEINQWVNSSFSLDILYCYYSIRGFFFKKNLFYEYGILCSVSTIQKARKIARFAAQYWPCSASREKDVKCYIAKGNLNVDNTHVNSQDGSRKRGRLSMIWVESTKEFTSILKFF